MSLSLRGLRFSWPGGPAVLDGLDLDLPPGGRVAVIAGNGAGKSTLARCAAGLAGSEAVLWRGRPLSALAGTDRVAIAQLVGQRPDLQLSGRAATVRAEIAFGPENLGLPRALIRDRVESAMQAMGLTALALRDPRRLSGGETQRLAIAGALAMRPALLILDEPLTDLDHEARDGLTERLSRLAPDMSILALDVSADAWRRQGFQVMQLRDGRLQRFQDIPQPSTLATRPEPRGQLVTIRDLDFAHDPARPLFRGVELDLPQGAAIAVTGPNGAGKTTLMRLIAGLERPSRGRITVAGVEVGRAKPKDLAAVLGMVFQNADRQFLAATVLDEAMMGLRLHRLPDPPGLARRALAALGLEALAHAHPLDLHNGARRLTAVAAAVAPRPQLLILDETQRGLDLRHQRQLEQAMTAFTQAGGTVLFVCHDEDFVKRNASHRLAVSGGLVGLHSVMESG
ncbi:ATP-binding cassette domain-containing protein [Paracoccus aminovorans]|uniref:ATP-binding cassette domain-containing protein n=1 Tax=Paracoccus aminovorans TaxID=34004 RepID=UPI002B25AD0B|nr:ATP-binding cassette domain-containing protein [Paracoccus aminovorans]